MALGDYLTASDNEKRYLAIGDTVTYNSPAAANAATTGVLVWEWLRRPTENRVRAFTVKANGTGVEELLPEDAFTAA